MEDDIREMSDAVADGTGYEGTDEYVPAHADAYELNKALPRLSDDDGAKVDGKLSAWGSTERRFTIQADQEEDVTVRLFDYPAWDVFVNGKAVKIERSDVTGLVVIPIAEGFNDVRITFRRTKDRLVGDIVSLLSLLIFLLLWLKAGTSKNRTVVQHAGLANPTA